MGLLGVVSPVVWVIATDILLLDLLMTTYNYPTSRAVGL